MEEEWSTGGEGEDYCWWCCGECCFEYDCDEWICSESCACACDCVEATEELCREPEEEEWEEEEEEWWE